jgi:dCMP deaminase
MELNSNVHPGPGQPSFVERVNVYVDGYNFYYSINHAATLHLGWCNFYSLGYSLTRKAFPSAVLGTVKYYTARIPKGLEVHSGEVARQKMWQDALRFGSQRKVQIVQGYFKSHEHKSRVEKETDISLAIGMVRDALITAADPRVTSRTGPDRAAPYDAAVLISADNDFGPAIRMVANYGKQVAIFVPPGNPNFHKPSHPNVQLHHLTEVDLIAARLPERIKNPNNGRVITWAGYRELKRTSRKQFTRPGGEDSDFDRNCLAECRRIAVKSSDPDTQVGCVIVGPEKQIRALGVNSLPNEVGSQHGSRLKRDEKYLWIEHAERNAIYAAAREGKSLDGCTLYADLLPCMDCARAIIQSGIGAIVVCKDQMDNYRSDRYTDQHELAGLMLREAGVEIRQIGVAKHSDGVNG